MSTVYHVLTDVLYFIVISQKLPHNLVVIDFFDHDEIASEEQQQPASTSSCFLLEKNSPLLPVVSAQSSVVEPITPDLSLRWMGCWTSPHHSAATRPIVLVVLTLAWWGCHRGGGGEWCWSAEAAAWVAISPPPQQYQHWPQHKQSQEQHPERHLLPRRTIAPCGLLAAKNRAATHPDEEDDDETPPEQRSARGRADSVRQLFFAHTAGRADEEDRASSSSSSVYQKQSAQQQMIEQLVQFTEKPPPPTSSSTSAVPSTEAPAAPKNRQSSSNHKRVDDDLWEDFEDDDDDDSMHVELDANQYLNAMNLLESDGSLRPTQSRSSSSSSSSKTPTNVLQSMLIPPDAPDRYEEEDLQSRSGTRRPSNASSRGTQQPTMKDLLQALQNVGPDGGHHASNAADASSEEIHQQIFQQEQGFVQQSEIFKAALTDPTLTDQAAAARRGTDFQKRQIRAVKTLEQKMLELEQAVAQANAARAQDPTVRQCPRCGGALLAPDDPLQRLQQPRAAAALCQICFAQEAYAQQTQQQRRGNAGAAATPQPPKRRYHTQMPSSSSASPTQPLRNVSRRRSTGWSPMLPPPPVMPRRTRPDDANDGA